MTEHDLATQVALLDQKLDELAASLGEIRKQFGSNGSSIPTRISRMEDFVASAKWVGATVVAAVIVLLVGFGWKVITTYDGSARHTIREAQ